MDDSRRCIGTVHTTGQRCKKAAILGGTVCQTHGGGAPQVKAKAERTIRAQLDALQDPPVRQLKTRVEDEERPALALRAAADILDRGGYKAPEKLDVRGVQAFLDASKVRGMDTEEIVELRRLLIKAGALTAPEVGPAGRAR